MPHPHLVDLLMTAKYLHPDISITPPPPTPIPGYDARRGANSHPSTPFPPSATHGLFARADANPNGQLNYIRKVPPGSTLPTSNAALSRQNSGTPKPVGVARPPFHPHAQQPQPPAQQQPAPQVQNRTEKEDNGNDIPRPDPGAAEEEEEESASPPPSPPYPRPGNGLMGRLKSDEEDLEWLVGGRDEAAFSHLVFGSSQPDMREQNAGGGGGEGLGEEGMMGI